MGELEEALGRLPDDPTVAPEPLSGIVSRAERRRRHRWQGRGAAAVVGLVALCVGITALVPESPQVVDSASRPGDGRRLPATGGVTGSSVVVAEGDVGGKHWRLLVRPDQRGLCLDIEHAGVTSSECGHQTGGDQAIAGGLSRGLTPTFLSGAIRKDVAGVRLDLDDGGSASLVPVGIDKGFDVNFFVSPVAEDRTVTKAIALDQLGAALGELRIDPAPEAPGDEIAAPRSPATSIAGSGPGSDDHGSDGPQGRDPVGDAPADDGNQSSPVQSIPSGQEPVGPPPVDPSLAACPTDQVGVTVTTGKTAYARGETVTGSGTIENRSSTACLIPARVFFTIENSAGEIVSDFAYTADYRMPSKAEPGQSFSGTFTWEQGNCDLPFCEQVPDGTYTAVGRWTEGASFSARASFQVGP